MGVKLVPPFKNALLLGGLLSKPWELFFRDLINRQEVIVDNLTTDGVDVAFTLSVEPKDENHTMAFVNGTYQQKSAYSVSGNTMTFSSAPASGWLEVVTHGR